MGIYATIRRRLALAAGPLVLAANRSERLAALSCRGGPVRACDRASSCSSATVSPTVERGTGRTSASFMAAAPAATLAALVFGALETAAYALLPIYGLAIGFTVERAALLVSTVALGNVACQIPLGLLSDRVDRRAVLLGAVFARARGGPAASSRKLRLASATLFLWGGLTGALYTVGLAHLGARLTGSDLVSANAAFVLLYNVGLALGPRGRPRHGPGAAGRLLRSARGLLHPLRRPWARLLRHPGKS